MIVPVMAISNLVLTQQIYSEETNGAHAHYREPVPLNSYLKQEKHVWASRIRQFRKTERINKICDESKMNTFLH